MKRVNATSKSSIEALSLAESMQAYFANSLKDLAKSIGKKQDFEAVEWFRNSGLNGGGVRLVSPVSDIFNRASINVSQVQYENLPEKRLNAATALSTIIHPANPHAPSIHMHISWTELKGGKGTWRIMADLNPSIASDDMKEKFDSTLKKVTKEQYEIGKKDGEKYFYIPSLERHRGVSHFYLEGYSSGDFAADKKFAESFFKTMVQCYVSIVASHIEANPVVSAESLEKQLNYYSLYFLQVLTLDRGTTSGLLIHNDNDVGVLGSIPSHVNRKTLESWVARQKEPQDALLESLISVLQPGDKVPVGDEEKLALCNVVREFYKNNPGAINLQAAGSIVPPTVSNHK